MLLIYQVSTTLAVQRTEHGFPFLFEAGCQGVRVWFLHGREPLCFVGWYKGAGRERRPLCANDAHVR